jgi:hypothetical protein
MNVLDMQGVVALMAHVLALIHGVARFDPESMEDQLLAFKQDEKSLRDVKIGILTDLSRAKISHALAWYEQAIIANGEDFEEVVLQSDPSSSDG